MSRRTKTQQPKADALLKPHVETNVKENANNEVPTITKVWQQNNTWPASSERRGCSKSTTKSWGQDFKMALSSDYG